MKQERLFDFKSPSKAVNFFFERPYGSNATIEPRWDLGGILVSWDEEEKVEWNV